MAFHTPAPSWFDVQKYNAADRLDFEGWRKQIGNRIFLATLLSQKMFDQFDQHFAQIQNAPFMDLEFQDNYAFSTAVYPLTYGVAHTLVSTLTPLAPGRKDSCDQLLKDDQQDSFAMHLHLTIDLGASKAEIMEDFAKLVLPALEENRRRFPRPREPGISKAVIEGWVDSQLLAYQDLVLWHQRQNQKIPSDDIIEEWLFLDEAAYRGKLRETCKKAEFAFTLSALRQLALAAERPAKPSNPA